VVETLTVVEPERATEPTTGEMVTLVPFRVLQVSTVLPPLEGSVAGLALNETHFGTSGGSSTVTVALQLTSAPASVYAFRVYNVVASGETESEPSTATSPIPLSMTTRVALVVCHESVEVAPLYIVIGLAVNASHDGAGGTFLTLMID
jgi:hypothetical protein